MLFFTRILDFQEDRTPEMERRREQRYTPGRLFPLQATIELAGEPRTSRIVDLSPSGLGIQVSGPPPTIGATARIHLMVENSWVEFPCRVAHLRTQSHRTRVGLTALFPDFETRKAYLQLIQPVAIGSTFRPVAPDEIMQAEPGLHRLLFTGKPGTELTVWRDRDAAGPLRSFICQFDDFLVQGALGRSEVQVLSRKFLITPRRTKNGLTFRQLAPAVQGEIRRLFRWTMANLSNEVSAEIRAFLQGFNA